MDDMFLQSAEKMWEESLKYKFKGKHLKRWI